MTTHPTLAEPVDTDRAPRAPRPARRLLAGAATVALALVLAGCSGGSGGAAANPAPSTAPAPSATAPPVGSTTAAPTGTLLWPVTDAAAARALQTQVDSGAQPWLLDPSEVATSYATSVLKWRAPSAGAPDGGSVVVTDPDAGSTTLTLVQPATTGTAGIWVVSADHHG